MSGVSLKDLVRTLNGALEPQVHDYPVSDSVLNLIQQYSNPDVHIDGAECQKLHDELLNIHAAKVKEHPEKLAAFLSCFNLLRPADLFTVDELVQWWEILVKPTFDSMGQAKAVTLEARNIVLGVLCFDDELDYNGKRAIISSAFTNRLLSIFLEKTKLPASTNKSAAYKEEQKQRFVSGHVEAVLLAYAKRRPMDFLKKLDSFVVQKEYRLQILGLLCTYVQLQGPHLYLVLQTPLWDHLLQCLEIDTSTTVISLALTALIMFMPHLCNSLADYLPRLFIIYTRVLCWDKFGAARLEEFNQLSRAPSPISVDGRPEDHTPQPPPNGVWQKLNASFETATSTTPDVSDYFSFLYGLYPLNFLSFIREPYKYLEHLQYHDIDHLDIDEDTIRQRSDQYRQQHIIHPNFLTLTAESELKDQRRWMDVEPAEITAMCIGLVNNDSPREPEVARHRHRFSTGPMPGILVPTEDIPHESLLSQDDESILASDCEENADGDGENSEDLENDSETDGFASGTEVPRSFNRRRKPANTQDSPIVKASDESCLRDMLKLQETLHGSFKELRRPNDSNPLSSQSTSGPPSAHPPASMAASPHLAAYVHTLHSNVNIPRSPALRPVASDTQGTIAYLQREVMLLKNDLNFERYLKQQQLSHIGHLQRKRMEEAITAAETQHMIHTNKSLKARLEETQKAYAAFRQEAAKSGSRQKKYLEELNVKYRALKEEQRSWKSDKAKQEFESAAAEISNLRKLLEQSETEGLRNRQRIESMQKSIEEVTMLKSFVDHLSDKLSEYEAKDDAYETQKSVEETALKQVERLKIRLAARDQEIADMQRKYEDKLQEIENEKAASAASAPAVSSPALTPSLQQLIESARSQSASQLASLKKSHQSMLQKYAELQLKCIELQAAREADNARANYFASHDGSSDTEGSHPHSSRTIRSYQPSEASMSPTSSYTESSNPSRPFSAMRDYVSSSTGTMSPGGFSLKYPGSAHMSPEASHVPERMDYFGPGHLTYPTLKSRPSMPESMTSVHGTPMSDDARSMKTVRSAHSSENKRKDKMKPGSELRIRGRGSPQNVSKDKKDKKDKEGEGSEAKPKKKSRFPTGSGLAGIRGFV